MADGDTIKFDQIADEAVGHIPGDLIFKIQQAPHEIFSRQGDNLYMTMTIKLIDSLVGFSRVIQHVDGHDVIVSKDTVTYCSEVVSIRGEGMPRKKNRSSRGDLFITLSIDFPGQFSEKQKEQLRTTFAI
jgi:DnaJ-class molecular chaperone